MKDPIQDSSCQGCCPVYLGNDIPKLGFGLMRLPIDGNTIDLEKARDIFNSVPKVPCTACAYCMKGCPEKIAIYGTFQAVNIYICAMTCRPMYPVREM